MYVCGVGGGLGVEVSGLLSLFHGLAGFARLQGLGFRV